MGSRFQRYSIRLSRGWALIFLFAGALLLFAYWLGPLEPPPARIELVAVDDGGASDTAVGQVRYARDGTLVFAVPIAARNTGARTARPRRVSLSVPSNFHVRSVRGRLTGTVTPGLPMRRYVIELPAPRLPADSTMLHLPGLDTIYLTPDLPRYYCHLQGLNIPEFEAAPALDPEVISDVRIFYSFTDGRDDDRHTGLLTVALDPERIRVEPAPIPPLFSTVVRLPEAPAPPVGPSWFAGARRAHCGDPMQPIELYTVLWENARGGRLFTVYVDGIGRKRLYDLNRDGVIELETWDGDADGYYEAMREARFETPAFLLPPALADSNVIAPDPLEPDLAWLAMFNDVSAGPQRFAQSLLIAHPQFAATDTVAADSGDARAAAARAATERAAALNADDPSIRAALEGLRPVDPAFVDLFNNAAAGPFRFSRRAPGTPPVVAGSPGTDTERGRASGRSNQPAARDASPRDASPGDAGRAGQGDNAAGDAPREAAPPRGRQPLGESLDSRGDAGRAPTAAPPSGGAAPQRQRREPLGTPVGSGGAP